MACPRGPRLGQLGLCSLVLSGDAGTPDPAEEERVGGSAGRDKVWCGKELAIREIRARKRSEPSKKNGDSHPCVQLFQSSSSTTSSYHSHHYYLVFQTGSRDEVQVGLELSLPRQSAYLTLRELGLQACIITPNSALIFKIELQILRS